MDESYAWLSQLYEDFDKDVQSLMEIEPLWHTCSSCPDGFCCQRETVPVMTPEWNKIVQYVRATFGPIQKRRYEQNIERQRIQCPFLVRNRCGVYSVRPWSCRIYPYTISFYHSDITNQKGDFIAPHCPNLAQRFDTQVGKIIHYKSTILERAQNINLVKIKIETEKTFWILDITRYQEAYERQMPKNELGVLEGDHMHNWVGLAKYARDTKFIDYNKYMEILGLD